MITKLKLKQLEKRYGQVIGKRRRLILRYVSLDGRLLDKEGYLLTNEEIAQVKKENEEAAQVGNIIFTITQYDEPQIRPV